MLDSSILWKIYNDGLIPSYSFSLWLKGDGSNADLDYAGKLVLGGIDEDRCNVSDVRSFTNWVTFDPNAVRICWTRY